MISFEPDDEQKLVLDNVRKFAVQKLFARLRETEAARAVEGGTVREAHELGLRVLELPEETGGQGLGLLMTCMVEETLAWGDPAACFALGGPGAFASFVLELGDAARQREALAPFTADGGAGRRGAVAFTETAPADRDGLSTTARRDGDRWVLDGDKALVVDGGLADRYIVIAQVEPDRGWDGLGAFVVEGDAEGLSAGERRRLLGLDAAHVADLRLDGVRVAGGARLGGEDGFQAALHRALARRALVNAARCIGAAGRAWELTHAYCTEREAFGKPIGHFQAVAFTVADRLMDVEAARWLLWRAASDWDRRAEPTLSDVAGAAAHAAETALACGDDGVQLFGGAGFIRDHPIEKLFRDARQLTVMGPSVETLHQWIAEAELGRDADPAVLFPTGDVQPVCL